MSKIGDVIEWVLFPNLWMERQLFRAKVAGDMGRIDAQIAEWERHKPVFQALGRLRRRRANRLGHDKSRTLRLRPVNIERFNAVADSLDPAWPNVRDRGDVAMVYGLPVERMG